MRVIDNWKFLLANQLLLIVFRFEGNYYLAIRDGSGVCSDSFPEDVIFGFMDEYNDQVSHRAVWKQLVSKAQQKAKELGLMTNHNIVTMLREAQLCKAN